MPVHRAHYIIMHPKWLEVWYSVRKLHTNIQMYIPKYTYRHFSAFVTATHIHMHNIYVYVCVQGNCNWVISCGTQNQNISINNGEEYRSNHLSTHTHNLVVPEIADAGIWKDHCVRDCDIIKSSTVWICLPSFSNVITWFILIVEFGAFDLEFTNLSPQKRLILNLARLFKRTRETVMNSLLEKWSWRRVVGSSQVQRLCHQQWRALT